MSAVRRRTAYRTLWISDVHLGSPGCQAARLADFLQRHDCEQLYLVGDIFDGWKMRTRFYWTPDQSRVIRAVIAKARRRTRVCYLTGNHDGFMRQFITSELPFGKIHLAHELVHTTADGRRLLILHGDIYDDLITRLPRLARAGDRAYNLLIAANALVNRARAGLGKPGLHIAGTTKDVVKTAVQFICGVDMRMQGRCERAGLQGVICGHTHHPEIRDLGEGITYYNCGDWVDSCTALAEDFKGNIRLIRAEPMPAQQAAAEHAAA
ncbi:MAG TPA: UDP-2,3-diacylglucosamine diphosphatase [Nevskia sp.]|nr:UDP-2,3-diacylglucosamine diphosphatase [Nevskia sp.]